ncbi:DUF6089 family protein [Winogradskyella maritima]|uniref:DUF6089 family protein n=1 Tax=Winogradskyella maritima TaxID=1517766 RepID=A0ABV8AH44_9FLAO|nr:DUF6089 family protein [Winogradskyella maritima]
MRYLVLLLVTVFTINTSHSQIYEAGIFVGGSNFVGDIGATNYINPNQLAIGGVFKWNRSPRHAYRFSVIYSELEGLDSKSNDPRRQQRNWAFNNDILELSVGLEFTFFDFNQHDLAVGGTPYLYGGFSYTKYDHYYFTPGGVQSFDNESSWTPAIPFALGYKYLVSPSLVLSAEVGVRYTFTDEIDGSVPSNPERTDLAFGNTNSDDWYVFSGLTLTYTFGQKPCYCYIPR